jgi:predicted metal-dependent hydrolase
VSALAVERGVRLFNRGRYLVAQEVWETAWREAAAEDRAFLEGLVQLAGSLHLRTERGAERGAVHLLSQALVLFEEYRPAAYGVDVEALVTEFAEYLEWLRGVGRPHRALDRLRIPAIRRG